MVPQPNREIHILNAVLWSYWIIARLGGWSGFSSQRKAGVITLFKGLQKFQLMFSGWNFHKKALMYKP